MPDIADEEGWLVHAGVIHESATADRCSLMGFFDNRSIWYHLVPFWPVPGGFIHEGHEGARRWDFFSKRSVWFRFGPFLRGWPRDRADTRVCVYGYPHPPSLHHPHPHLPPSRRKGHLHRAAARAAPAMGGVSVLAWFYGGAVLCGVARGECQCIVRRLFRERWRSPQGGGIIGQGRHVGLPPRLVDPPGTGRPPRHRPARKRQTFCRRRFPQGPPLRWSSPPSGAATRAAPTGPYSHPFLDTTRYRLYPFAR